LEELGSEFLAQMTKILVLLTRGRPVAVSEVAADIGMSQDDTKELLLKYGGEFNKSGELVGLGLTSAATPHKFEVDGHRLYAWCAGDTLIFPALLGKTARIESLDPISRETIRFTSTPGGPQDLQPSTALLSWPRHADAASIRESVCYPSLWFASEATARKYAAENPGVTIRSPQEFREFLRVLPERGSVQGAGCGPAEMQSGPSKGPSCH